MPVIAQGNGFTISSNFGRSILEGSLSTAQGLGAAVSFQITQSPQTIRSAYVQIVPISGQTSDFWDNFWSNRIGGEPADQFALSWFMSLDGTGSVTATLNADSYAEQDETFAIRIYESNMDAAWNRAPLFQTTFTILDDDRLATQGNDTLWAGAGNDIMRGLGGNDMLSSGSGDDRLFGDAGNDTLRGEAGNDTFWGGAGNDVIIGGAGIDTAVFSGAVRHHVHLGVTVAQNTGEGRDQLAEIENLTGGAGTDIFLGNAAANVLRGEAGNDQLYGGGGNDTVYGGPGDDYLHGGADADWAIFSGPEAVVVEMRRNVVTGQGTDTIAGIEHIETGSGNDRLIGNAHRNELKGGAGNDTIAGGGGSDILTGGSGADHFAFAGWEGNDRVTDFQGGVDRIVIEGGRVDSFSDLSIANSIEGAVVNWGNATTILLVGVHASNLSAADFIFG